MHNKNTLDYGKFTVRQWLCGPKHFTNYSSKPAIAMRMGAGKKALEYGSTSLASKNSPQWHRIFASNKKYLVVYTPKLILEQFTNICTKHNCETTNILVLLLLLSKSFFSCLSWKWHSIDM